LPEAPREWSLAGARKKQKAEADDPKDRTCDSCGRRHTPAPVCPHCGHRHAGEAREVERVDGDLSELTEDERERLMRLRTRPLHDLVAAARSRTELHQIARARSFKPGWVFHTWNRLQAERAAEAAA
jgi:ribosomal protein L32